MWWTRSSPGRAFRSNQCVKLLKEFDEPVALHKLDVE